MNTTALDNSIHARLDTDCRELSASEVSRVSGATKWERGTKNSDVVDARGGSISMLGWVVDFDINGNASGVRRRW
jgi:hypothetical protein